MWCYVKLKGRWQSKEITARWNMGMERMVSYNEGIEKCSRKRYCKILVHHQA